MQKPLALVASTAFIVLAAALLAACNSSKPASSRAPAAKDAAKVGTDSAAGATGGPGQVEDPSKLPDAKVVAEHCGDGPGAALLTAMKDGEGFIGGYIYRRAIRDSPVFYLDPMGKQVAMFHIFGPPEEKKLNEPKIDSLRAAYPIEEDIPCPGAKAPGAP